MEDIPAGPCGTQRVLVEVEHVDHHETEGA